MNSDRIKPQAQYLRIARNAAQRSSGYRTLFKAAIGKDELAKFRYCTHKGRALGAGEFKQAIETGSQRQAGSRGVGRPRAVAVDDDKRF